MGGGSIQTLGADRLRIATAVAALVLACVLAALPVIGEGDRTRVLAVLAAAGIAALAVGLSGRSTATWWAVAILGGEYAALFVGRDTVDVRAPLVGTALFLVAELARWSVRPPASPRGEPGMITRRLVDLGAIGLASLALGSLVVAVGDVRRPGGLELAAAGVVACSATLGLIFALARQRTDPTP